MHWFSGDWNPTEGPFGRNSDVSSYTIVESASGAVSFEEDLYALPSAATPVNNFVGAARVGGPSSPGLLYVPQQHQQSSVNPHSAGVATNAILLWFL